MLKADNRLDVEIIAAAAPAFHKINGMALSAIAGLPGAKSYATKPALFSHKITAPNMTEFCFKVNHV